VDHQTFESSCLHILDLDQFECGCSFSDDTNVYYYCVGTAYVLPEENEPTKVRKSSKFLNKNIVIGFLFLKMLIPSWCRDESLYLQLKMEGCN
jgi:hypothetical protein